MLHEVLLHGIGKHRFEPLYHILEVALNQKVVFNFEVLEHGHRFLLVIFIHPFHFAHQVFEFILGAVVLIVDMAVLLKFGQPLAFLLIAEQWLLELRMVLVFEFALPITRVHGSSFGRTYARIAVSSGDVLRGFLSLHLLDLVNPAFVDQPFPTFSVPFLALHCIPKFIFSLLKIQSIQVMNYLRIPCLIFLLPFDFLILIQILEGFARIHEFIFGFEVVQVGNAGNCVPDGAFADSILDVQGRQVVEGRGQAVESILGMRRVFFVGSEHSIEYLLGLQALLSLVFALALLLFLDFLFLFELLDVVLKLLEDVSHLLDNLDSLALVAVHIVGKLLLLVVGQQVGTNQLLNFEVVQQQGQVGLKISA